MKSRFTLFFVCIAALTSCTSSVETGPTHGGLLGSADAHTATYVDTDASTGEFAKLTLDDKGAFVAQMAGAPTVVEGSYTNTGVLHFVRTGGVTLGDFDYTTGDNSLELTSVATSDRFVMIGQPLAPSGPEDSACSFPVTCEDGTTGCADTSDPCVSHGGDCSPTEGACVTDYDCCPGLACDNASATPTYSCVAASTCSFPVTCVDGTTGCADTSDPCTTHGGECSAASDGCTTDFDCCPNTMCDNTGASPTYTCVAG